MAPGHTCFIIFTKSHNRYQTVLEASPSYSCIKVQIMHKFISLRFVQEIIVSLSNYQPLRHHQNFTADDILLPNNVENLNKALYFTLPADDFSPYVI